MFGIRKVRTMTRDEAYGAERAWQLSPEKKILDEKQEKLREAIARKAGSYSPVEHETGRLW